MNALRALLIVQDNPWCYQNLHQQKWTNQYKKQQLLPVHGRTLFAICMNPRTLDVNESSGYKIIYSAVE